MDETSVVIPKGQEVFYDRFHFAPAVKDGDRLFCSGVIGIGPDGKCAPEPETQFKQAFESLGAVLREAGASFADVIELTTFHVGLQQNLRGRRTEADHPGQALATTSGSRRVS